MNKEGDKKVDTSVQSQIEKCLAVEKYFEACIAQR